LEHEDAGINSCAGTYGKTDEEIFNLNEILRKTNKKYNGNGKYSFLPNYSLKKVCTTTFGTTERFAPEPGSVHSKSQTRVLNSFKKSTTGIGAPSSSSSKL
jgi:hypothetical protein